MSFPAKFPGKCLLCETWFEVDTPIKFADGHVVHETCPMPTDPTTPNNEICDRCFTEKSNTGECACED